MGPLQHLNIIHVVDSLEYGGLERVVADLAVAQAAHGHAVRVFSISDTNGFRASLEAAGIPVEIGGKQGAFDLGVLRALRRASLRGGADILHTHNFVPSYYAAAATRFALRRPALVNTCHNMGARLGNRRLRGLYSWSLRHTARVALVGQQVRDSLVSLGVVPQEKADVVLNGVPTDRTSGSRRDARARLGLPTDARVLGCVGRLVELKRHRLLIDAMPDLLIRHPDLHAVIVGEGPLEAALRARIAELGLDGRVLLTGARNDVPDLLPAFDVFVLPSRTEGLSIALLEACAAGLAIVATDVGGNGEIVHDGDTGRLVPSDDPAALAQALDELLGDDAGRQRFGQAAREWVVAHGSVDAMRQNYDTVYAKALDATS